MTRPASLRILLVDDNEDDITLTKAALARSGLLSVVATAANGVEALSLLRAGAAPSDRPALVLVDLNMPVMGGLAFLEAVKADPALRSLPVIILTSSDSEDDVLRAFAGGAASYLRKPVDVDEFDRMVRLFEAYWTSVSRMPPR